MSTVKPPAAVLPALPTKEPSGAGKPSESKTPASSRSMYLLHEGTGRRIKLFDGMVIGRSQGHENFPWDIKMSRRHCDFQVAFSSQKITVRDLGSSNHTRVDQVVIEAMKSADLKLGSLLEIGGQKFTVVAKGAELSPLKDLELRLPSPARAPEGVELVDDDLEVVGESQTNFDEPHPLGYWTRTTMLLALLLAGLDLLGLAGKFAQVDGVHNLIYGALTLKLLFLINATVGLAASLTALYVFSEVAEERWYAPIAIFMLAFLVNLSADYSTGRITKAQYRLVANGVNESCLIKKDRNSCMEYTQRIKADTRFGKSVLAQLPDNKRQVIERWLRLFPEAKSEATSRGLVLQARSM